MLGKLGSNIPACFLVADVGLVLVNLDIENADDESQTSLLPLTCLYNFIDCRGKAISKYNKY